MTALSRLGYLALTLLLASCTSKIGDPLAGTADARPIDFSTPDDPVQTTPGCDGVDSRGDCDGDFRRYCDLAEEKLVRVDCGALGGSCEFDSQRDLATCVGVDADTAPNACLAMGAAGICGSSGEVLWCSGAAEEDIQVQLCGTNEECQIDGCVQGGAYCCPEAGLDECTLLGDNGTCEDNKRKYCENGEVKFEDCEANGENCFIFDTDGVARCDGADFP